MHQMRTERERGEGTAVPQSAELWESFNALPGTGVFWKDDRRRFLGVSRFFLEYYGLPGVESVLGRTDEDMGWHIDPEPYRRDEWEVLREGRVICDAPGTCIIRGEVRSIRATKAPVRDAQGRIIGLVGYFRDVTQRDPEPDPLSYEYAFLTDSRTGVLNFRGLERALEQYEEGRRSRGIDYAAVLVRVELPAVQDGPGKEERKEGPAEEARERKEGPDRKEPAGQSGPGGEDREEGSARADRDREEGPDTEEREEQTRDRLMCAAGRRLQESLGLDCVIGRYGQEEFLVLHQLSGGSTVQELEDRIRQAIPSSLRPILGWARSSECRDISELIRLADERMSREGEAR